jgi:hypothetical protein
MNFESIEKKNRVHISEIGITQDVILQMIKI